MANPSDGPVKMVRPGPVPDDVAAALAAAREACSGWKWVEDAPGVQGVSWQDDASLACDALAAPREYGLHTLYAGITGGLLLAFLAWGLWRLSFAVVEAVWHIALAYRRRPHA